MPFNVEFNELGKGSVWIFELGKFDEAEVSFGILKSGEYDKKVSFYILDCWVS